MSNIDLTEILCKTEFFKDLTPEQASAIARVLEFKEFTPGNRIVRQSEQGDEFFIIVDGTAQVLIEDEQLNTQQIVLTLQAGQSFGETALLAQEKRSATVQAMTHTVCAVLSKADFESVMSSIPGIALSVCRYLAVRLATQCRLTGFRFVPAQELVYDPRVYRLFPQSLLERCEAIPIGISGRTLTIALTRPNDPSALELLSREVPGMGLEPVGCTREDYEDFNRRYRSGAEREPAPVYEQGKISLQYLNGGRLSAPLRRVLEALLTQGLDFAIVETDQRGVVAQSERDGQLQPILEPEEEASAKDLQAELDNILSETTGGQHCGESKMLANGHPFVMALSALRNAHRCRYSIQLFDGNQKVPSLEALFLSPRLLGLLLDATKEPGSLVLLSGGQASGLGTSLLSLARYQTEARGASKVLLFQSLPANSLAELTSWPLDAPMEELMATAQRQRTAVAIFDNLNQDQMRDLLQRPLQQTSVIAGFPDSQNLFSTLAESAVSFAPGLRALRAVFRQEVAFRICDHCREPANLTIPEVRFLKESGLDNQAGGYFRGTGCSYCGNSGVRGKVPIFEAMRFDPDNLQQLRGDESFRNKTIRDATIHTFRDHARTLIEQGLIDPVEGLRLFPPASAAFALP